MTGYIFVEHRKFKFLLTQWTIDQLYCNDSLSLVSFPVSYQKSNNLNKSTSYLRCWKPIFLMWMLWSSLAIEVQVSQVLILVISHFRTDLENELNKLPKTSLVRNWMHSQFVSQYFSHFTYILIYSNTTSRIGNYGIGNYNSSYNRLLLFLS